MIIELGFSEPLSMRTSALVAKGCIYQQVHPFVAFRRQKMDTAFQNAVLLVIESEKMA